MRDILAPVAAADDPFTADAFEQTPSERAATLEHFRALRRHINATAEHVWRFADLDPHIQRLEEMIFTLDDHGLTSTIFLSSLSFAQVALQQVAYCQWETELERRFVHSLDDSGSFDDYPLAPRFRRLLEREIELFGPGVRSGRMLFIGSGPFPISAILAHEYLGVTVDCVDIDSVAVAHSRRLLEQRGLADAVRVFHSDGCDVDASRYDGILIALLAKPKHQILAGIARSVRKDCRVVCRTSEGLRVLVYEPIRIERDLRLHEICDKRSALGDGDTISSLLVAAR